MFSCRASRGMDHISRRYQWNGLRLSHRHGNAFVMLDVNYGFIWVVPSISTARLVSSSTSVNWVRSQRVLHRRHHVYHYCARPSKSCEVHSVAFKSILIDWKDTMFLIFTRIDLLSQGQWLWLQGALKGDCKPHCSHINRSRDFCSNLCRYAHRRYLATVTVEWSQTSTSPWKRHYHAWCALWLYLSCFFTPCASTRTWRQCA
jgi:hypothetical protein